MNAHTNPAKETISILTVLLFVLTIAWTGTALAHSKRKLTRTNDEGPVTISATYLNPIEKKGNDELRFQVKLDTHSVDLDQYVLENLSFIQLNDGSLQKSIGLNREGSGHHVTNILRFAGPIPNGTNTLTVIIRDVGGVAERLFKWELPLH